MKQQLIDLNLFFDWDREISTCDPKYYKWTQFIFIKMFEAGLAYKAEDAVNWDPVDKTVLADEQVDEEGRSWRSSAVVERKFLKQWFLRHTRYSKSLLSTMDDFEESVNIKSLQRNWIGDVNGYNVAFKIKINKKITGRDLLVFCLHPEMIPSMSHINVNFYRSEFITNEFSLAGHTDVDLSSHLISESPIPSISAINPLTEEEVPLIFTNEFKKFDRSIARAAIPKINENDLKIAEKNSLNLHDVKMYLTRQEAIDQLVKMNCTDGHMVSFQLRDWLISRQRRWGTPIPAVNCPNCGPVMVDISQLPVTLPPSSVSLDEWKKTKCPRCGSEAEKETDTMDTFVDSSWYFQRFTDPHNEEEPFSRKKSDEIMPVDLYIGGVEHAVLHLVFARFFNHFFYDHAMTSQKEPFKKILAQGLIKGKTFKSRDNAKYLSADEVVEKDGVFVEKISNLPVDVSFEKMSKSKFNGVDPASFVAEWGISLTRLFVLSAAAPQDIIEWDLRSDVIPGTKRWQLKLWKMVGELLKLRNCKDQNDTELTEEEKEEEADYVLKLNDCISNVTLLMESATKLNAAISHLMIFTSDTLKCSEGLKKKSIFYEAGVCSQIIMATPMIPQFTSELWEGVKGLNTKLTTFQWHQEVLDQTWPKLLPCIQPPRKVWIVKVNGKFSKKIRLPHDIQDQRIIFKEALSEEKVQKHLNGFQVNERYLKNNIVNLVTDEQKKNKFRKRSKKI